MAYVDVDKFAQAICDFRAIDEDCANKMIYLLRTFPTADVVEVVRCEHCEHGDVNIFSKTVDGQEEVACYCNLKNKVTDVDGSCLSGRSRVR